MLELDRFRPLLFVTLIGLLVLGIGGIGAVPAQGQVIDFEDGSIPSDWTESSGSTAAWSVTSATSAGGTYSLGSGDITHDETSEIEVTITVPKDTVITFDYRVSSEDSYDFFRFYIDGVQELERSGDTGWLSSGDIPISAGTHIVRWSYEKDGSVSNNADKAWIDNVALPPEAPPSGLLAQAASVSDVQLGWSDRGGVDQYKIYRDTAPIDSSSGPSSYTAIDSVGGSATQYLDTGTSTGTTYYYRITAVDPNGQETGFSRPFSVTPGHAATALRRGSGTPGATVRIVGKGFDPTASNNTVSFGGNAASVTAAQPSVLTVEVPSTASVTVPVTVETGSERDTVGTRFQVLDSNTGTRAFVDTSLTGVSQSDAAWGDFEAEGNQDLVVAGGGTTTLYQNDGSGTFTNPSVGLTGVGSGAAVAWGDYDNDEELELVVAGGLSTTVYQWEGDGSDTFQSITLGFEGVSQAAADWGDYDNDGDLDLLVSGLNGSGNPSTTLYRNDGGDNFTAVSAGLPDLSDGAVAWGDYNDDGLQDVALVGATGSGRTTQIYRNQGDSTFTPVEAGLTAVEAGAVSWGDYDGDGNLDLLVTGDEGGGVASTTLYRNDGNGTFAAVDGGLVDVFNSDADWGDYDGDGDLDLVLTGETGSDTTTVLYRNDGMGDFTGVDAGLTGVTNGSVDWADQNDDGVLDLVLTGVDASDLASVRIYESTPAPPPPPSELTATTFADSVQVGWAAVGASDLTEYRIYRDTSPIDSLNYASATPLDTISAGTTTYTDTSVSTGTEYYYRVTAADVDSESGASVQVSDTPTFRLAGISPSSGAAGTAVQVYGNGFGPAASDHAVSFVDTTGTATSATATDAQGTILTVEVPSGVEGPARVAVERSDGATDTTTARITPIGANVGDRSFASVNLGVPNLQEADLAWGDYDGDGDLDAAVNGIDGTVNVTAIYRNDGNGTFTDIAAGLTDVAIGSVDWVDYDRDGTLDLLVTGRDGSANPQTILYRNDGGGTFTEVSAGLVDVSGSDAAWGDYNGDGYPDLVLAGNDGSGPRSVLYRNDGDGTFTPVDAGLAGVEGAGLDWADYDGDGALDLVVAGREDNGPSTILYHNDGGGQFSAEGANLIGVSTGGTDVEVGVGVEWGDYDADGDSDLIVTGLGDGGEEVAAIYRNDGGGTFTEVGGDLTGVQMGDATWGDYDGDGDLDLVVTGRDADFNPRTILYRNEGNDSFVTRDAGLTGMSFSTVAWGDYDGDGALDLVTLGRDGNNNPLTAAYQSQPEPYPPSAVRATARADSVQLDWGGSTATDLTKYYIYRDTAPLDSTAGPSSYTPYDSVAAGTTSFGDTNVTVGTSYYYRVTAADATPSESGFTEQVSGTPEFRLSGVAPTSGTPGTVVRVSGNGFDLSGGSTVSFIDTTGTATSATVTDVQATALTVEVPPGLDGSSRIAVERSTGEKDTTAARFTPIGVNIGDRSFAEVASADTTLVGVENGNAAWGDYDGDDDQDVVLTGTDGSSIPSTTLYRNDSGTFTVAGANLIDLENSDVAWGDYDGDGDLDLAITGNTGTEGGSVTRIYENDGGTFGAIGAGMKGLDDGGIDWADYDGDGDLDLAVSGAGGTGTASTIIYRNDRDSTFTRVEAGIAGVRGGTVQWGDYDGDGTPDLAVMGYDGSSDRLLIYRNDGDGTFTEVGAGLSGVSSGDLDWGDYDGDGDLDLAVVGSQVESEVTAIYRHDGSGTFTSLDAGLMGVGDGSQVDWGDYDGDGDLDLIVTGRDESFTESTTLYQNRDDGRFVEASSTFLGATRSSVDWGDYDGDGTLDLLVTGEVPTGVESTETVARLYQSQANPPAPSFADARPAEGQKIRVQWDSSAAGDLGKYYVYRDTAPFDTTAASADLSPLDSMAAGTRSYLDSSGLGPNTRYHYRIAAVDTTGAESVFSPGARAIPKPAAGTLYVDQSASGANDGSSWSDALTYLREATDSVNANPYTDYEIRVAEGVYYPDESRQGNFDDTTATFRLQVDDVSLLGGYPSGGGARDPETNVTVLSGDITQDDSTTSMEVTAVPSGIKGGNVNTVLFLDGSVIQDAESASEAIRSNTIIDGVTITGGRAPTGQAEGDGGTITDGRGPTGQAEGSEGITNPLGSGGGVYCQGGTEGHICSPVFRDVTFRGNAANEGGAVGMIGGNGGVASPSFRDVVFRANRAHAGGGAVVIRAGGGELEGVSSPQFTETTFRENEATRGGAVNFGAGAQGRVEPVFVNVQFYENAAHSKGGAVLGQGVEDGVLRPSFANALFYGNSAEDEGGAAFHSGVRGATVAPVFTNATLVGNRADVVGGGLYNEGSDASLAPEIQNTIFWGNEAGTGGDAVANNDATPVFTHSLVEGSGGSGASWKGTLGADDGGNVDLDPLLVDTSAADFRLQEDSRVLDAGLNSALPADTTDLDADGDSTETLPLGLADSTRVVDGDGDGTATVNMGAYEVVGPDLTPLAAPESVAITAFTDSLRVGWSAIADGDLVKYRIYRDTTRIDSAAGPSSRTPLDSVAAGTTVYTDATVASDTTYHYRVTAVDEAGNESGFSPEVRDSAATALTVWPGDTDNDDVVNQDDVLPLGFQWGQTGPARDSTGCAFEGRAAAAWPTRAATYADANGDGVVDQNDVLCIGLNWGDSTNTTKSRPLYVAASPGGKKLTTPDASGDRPALGAGADRRAAKTSEPGEKGAVESGRLELSAPTEPDSVLWVAVRVRDVTDVGGAAFEVTYPASEVSIETVEVEDWFGEGALAQSHVDGEAGVVGVGIANADTVRGGSGVLARLKVRLDEAATDPVALQLRKGRIGRAPGRIVSLEVGTGVSVRRVPETFKLYGNYPNPVQRRTTIRYDLPSERHVKLRVYDVLGRHVATLVDGKQKPGQKTVTWQASEMASGVYVYRLTAGDQSETGKVTVVR